MAGHSKWKNIQGRKGAQDAKRGKVFTKIAVELAVAARAGGGNPDDNARLRQALAKAKAANMPKDNWMRAIKKGTGELEGVNYVERSYEGYGPGGVAVFVQCLTDNGTRTVAEVRHAFSRSGGNFGTDGSVAWMFQRKGVLVYEASKIKDYDAFLEKAIECGADDVDDSEGYYEVQCDAPELMTLKEHLDSFCEDPEVCEVSMVPESKIAVPEDKKDSLEKLINMLEDLDDVQSVSHNGDI
jgi:YebC/PmpR family DNA-binding regulatory protein